MRILFMCTNAGRTAIYVRAYHLAKALSLRGHDVTLMAVSSDSRFKTKIEEDHTVKIILCPRILHGGFILNRLTSGPGYGPLDIFQRIKVGMSGNYDIIQMFDHFPNIAIPFNYLRKRTNSKFVSDWCDIYHLSGGLRETYGYRLDFIYNKLGFLFKNYCRFIESDLRRKADAVTVISHGLREIAIQQGVAKEKIHVIEGGVDVDTVKPLPKMEARQRSGLPANSKIIAFMGTFKGDLDIAIGSFAKVRKDIPNSLFVVIGTPSPRAKELAANLGIADSYIEVGRCTDNLLPQYLSCADVFVLPFKDNLFNKTRWPNKMGEYMACGRPTVVSDVGDVAEVVRNNGIGLVATPGVEGFAEKIRILLTDDKLAEDMGVRAREIACQQYSWASMAVRLKTIYSELLSLGPR